MDEPINEPDEEAQLLARLAEIQKRKQEIREREQQHALALMMDAEWEHRRAEASKPVLIYGFDIQNDMLYFKTDTVRDDVAATIRQHKSVIYDYNLHYYKVEPTEWFDLEKKLMSLQSIFIKYGDVNAQKIRDWKPSPNFTVSLDRRAIFVQLGPKANTYLLRSMPGASFNNPRRRFEIPFTEAWRIPGALKESEHVVYEPDAMAFIETQITKRGKLDEIAKREKPLEEMFMKDGIKLHDYQAVTVEYSEAAGGKMLIGHEMGLGKTPCALAITERMADRQEGSKFLIIVPAALRPNWERQIRKFTNFSPYNLYGSIPSNFDIGQVIGGKHRYYLINYDLVGEVTKIPEKVEINEHNEKIVTAESKRFQWVDVLNLGSFDAVIIDEAHYIKNVGSNRSQAIRGLTIPRTLLLTGTPLLNRPDELWPLIHKLDEEAAGPYETFVNWYTTDGKTPKNVEELREVLKPLMFRKIKKDVLKELPPINRITRDFALSPTARGNYEKVLDGLWAGLKDWNGDMSNVTVINSILAKLMRMKQVVAWDKVDYIADLATELYDQSTNGHKKVLIFSQFVNEPALVPEIANRLGNEALWFGGNHDINDRMRLVDQFQADPDIHFLVAGMKSAREGLDITAAGSVIFADLDWTPANHHQAEARAYGRLSDLHSISSYYVVADGTIEEDIMGLLERKLNIFNAIIEGTEQARDTSIVGELLKILKGRM